MAWLLLLFGVGLRLQRYATHLPLDVDEQLVALNIATRSYRELLNPLSLAQAAPPLFLWLEHALVSVAGINEWTLRALPLFAGILTLPLAWRFARRNLGSEAAVLVVGLLALSPMLVYESAFVKPYTLDALVTVILLNACLSPGGNLNTWRGSVRLVATGVLAIGSSLPSAFTLAPLGTANLFDSVKRKEYLALPRAAFVGGVWFASLVATLASTHRDMTNGSLAGLYMHDFWDRGFLISKAPGLMYRVRDAVADTFRGGLAGDPTFFPGAVTLPGVGIVFMLLAAIGAASLLKRRSSGLATVLTGPLVLVVVASSLQIYPIATRLMLWSAPLVACLVAAAVMQLAALVPARRSLATIALSAAVLAPGAIVRGQQARHDASLRELLKAVPHDGPLYVYPGGIPAWLLYSTDWRAPDRERLQWGMGLADLGGAAAMFRWRLQEHIGSLQMPDSALVYSGGARVELLGRSSGLDFVHASRRWLARPEPGWAAGEVVRLRGSAKPCLTLLLIHIDPAESRELHRAVADASGQIVALVERPDKFSFVESVCFPLPSSDSSKLPVSRAATSSAASTGIVPRVLARPIG